MTTTTQQTSAIEERERLRAQLAAARGRRAAIDEERTRRARRREEAAEEYNGLLVARARGEEGHDAAIDALAKEIEDAPVIREALTAERSTVDKVEEGVIAAVRRLHRERFSDFVEAGATKLASWEEARDELQAAPAYAAARRAWEEMAEFWREPCGDVEIRGVVATCPLPAVLPTPWPDGAPRTVGPVQLRNRISGAIVACSSEDAERLRDFVDSFGRRVYERPQ